MLSMYSTAQATAQVTPQHNTSHVYPAQHSTAQHSTAQHSTAQHSTVVHCNSMLGPGMMVMTGHLAAAWRAASAANAACLCSAVCAALRQQITR